MMFFWVSPFQGVQPESTFFENKRKRPILADIISEIYINILKTYRLYIIYIDRFLNKKYRPLKNHSFQKISNITDGTRGPCNMFLLKLHKQRRLSEIDIKSDLISDVDQHEQNWRHASTFNVLDRKLTKI